MTDHHRRPHAGIRGRRMHIAIRRRFARWMVMNEHHAVATRLNTRHLLGVETGHRSRCRSMEIVNDKRSRTRVHGNKVLEFGVVRCYQDATRLPVHALCGSPRNRHPFERIVIRFGIHLGGHRNRIAIPNVRNQRFSAFHRPHAHSSRLDNPGEKVAARFSPTSSVMSSTYAQMACIQRASASFLRVSSGNPSRF